MTGLVRTGVGKEMKQNRKLLLVGLLVIFTLMACRSLSPSTLEATVPEPVQVATPAVVNVVVPDLVSQQDTLVGLYEQISPGVVAIQVLTESGDSLGSGFVYDKEGHIVTNYHVVEGVTDLEVDFPSGVKVRGKVIGTDLDSDLAVIKVDVSQDELVPLEMGDPAQIKVGQTVVAIGNPFGYKGSMSIGIVSAVGRTLDSMHQAPGGSSFFTAGEMIQTDTAINPGNSGGPLLNLKGEVVGVNRAIQTDTFSATGTPVNSGVGFAISVGIVRRVVPSLITAGKFDYPYLGITSRPEISLLEQESLGLPRASGAYVMSITQGSPADKAGLVGGSHSTNIPGLEAGGDLIIAVDGKEILAFNDLLSYLIIYKSPGDSIVLTILRNKKEMEVTLVLDKRP
jgi:2-alkenal reductase